MQKAANYMLGTHDFRNLCKMDVGNGVVNFTRTVDYIQLQIVSCDSFHSSICEEEDRLVPAQESHLKDINLNQFNDCKSPIDHFSDGQCPHSNPSSQSQSGIPFSQSTPSQLQPSSLSSQSLPVLSIPSSQSQAVSDTPPSQSRAVLDILSQSQVVLDTPSQSQVVSDTLSQSQEAAPSGYDLCTLTLRSRGFLWHQVRAIMAILLLVGEGKEKPEVVRELLDVERYPRKPQYCLASEVPLCLYEAEYDPQVVAWRVCEETKRRTVESLQRSWAQHSIRWALLYIYFNTESTLYRSKWMQILTNL